MRFSRNAVSDYIRMAFPPNLSNIRHVVINSEANREMTRPQFMESLKLLFPELTDLPHNDTLMRLLASIDVEEIESALIGLVRKLIRAKKFVRYLVDNRHPVAIEVAKKLFTTFRGVKNVCSVK
ncbi:MAG: transposase family protein [bacterium]|nr:transposase family protein [bacterium]